MAIFQVGEFLWILQLLTVNLAMYVTFITYHAKNIVIALVPTHGCILLYRYMHDMGHKSLALKSCARTLHSQVWNLQTESSTSKSTLEVTRLLNICWEWLGLFFPMENPLLVEPMEGIWFVFLFLKQIQGFVHSFFFWTWGIPPNRYTVLLPAIIFLSVWQMGLITWLP